MYFDAHSDLWSDVTRRRLLGETDVLRRHHLPRLRQGGVEGSIFVIWIEAPYRTDYAARTRQFMECIRAEAAECDEIRIVRSSEEMRRARQDGKIYIFIGLEGLAAMGDDVGKLDWYYDFGARHAMLTWNEVNALGAGAMSGSRDGLTEAGKETVKRLQAKGMLLDVSHLNEAGFWDAAKLAVRPFIASHSNCKALCDVPRNLTDEQLRAIRDAGGVVGLNAYRGFVDTDPEKQTVRRFAEHAAHMIDVMGIDHVGCGFDFVDFLQGEDQGTAVLGDCTGISGLFSLFEEMGMSPQEREKIARGNFLRVIAETVD
ncbi:MAG: membrane dipeptidase [Oscillibacter sp.]|jgi:membrane dipeptidase|nr:membrane dipeptidase [Oscillibacter sp.]